MSTWKHRLLWGAWGVSFFLAVLLGAISAQGILHSIRAGEPAVPIDLSTTSEWKSASFRVWGRGTYKLFISSVNHDTKFVNVPLAGDFEVAVVDSSGRPVFENIYSAGSTDHALPSNYGDSQLSLIAINDWPLRKWTLKARVLKGDPRFNTAHTEVKFWKERYDPGMGGMVYFVLIFPAIIFLLIAIAVSLCLAAKGPKWPLYASLMCAVAFVALFVA